MPNSPQVASVGSCDHPLVILKRALHFQGKWPHPLRQRIIRTHTLLYMKRGAGELTINHVKIRIAGGQLILLTPGTHVMEQADGQADWDVHYVAFKLMRSTRERSRWSIQEFGSAPLLRSGEWPVVDVPRIDRLIGQLYEEDGIDSGLLRWKKQLALAELLYMLMLEHNTRRNQSPAHAARSFAAYMDQHYADNIRIGDISRSCGTNPSTFSRIFKQTIGMSPSDYLTRARIEAAKAMLLHSGRMREVSQRVGFCDEYYFSRIFKKVTGVAPSVYIRTTRGQPTGREAGGRVLEPTNVAVTYIDEADHLIALGLLPAAVPDDHALDNTESVIPYLKRYIREVPRIGCERTIDKGLLRRLSPSMIIAGRFLRDWGITGLEEIARTHYYIWQVDWRNIHWELAKTLDREAQAEQNIRQFDRLVRNVRERMFRACIRKRFAFLEVTREGVRVSPYMSNGGWLLFQQIGLTPSSLVSLNDWSHFVEPREAASIQADYLFIGRRSGSQRVYESFMSHPDVQGIRSKLVEVPRYPWCKGGPIAFSRGVNYMCSVFEKKHK